MADRMLHRAVALIMVLAAAFAPQVHGQAAPVDAAGSGADAAGQYVAVTTKDPAIPVDQLDLMLRPLTKQELAVEADAWFALLRLKVKQISSAELAVKQKNVQIKKAEQAAEAMEEARQAVEQAQLKAAEAATTVDADTAKEAQEAAREAAAKARDAAKAAEEAKAAEKKDAQNEEVKAATEEAAKKAEQKAKEQAEEEALDAAPPAIDPAAPASPGDAAAPATPGSTSGAPQPTGPSDPPAATTSDSAATPDTPAVPTAPASRGTAAGSATAEDGSTAAAADASTQPADAAAAQPDTTDPDAAAAAAAKLDQADLEKAIGVAGEDAKDPDKLTRTAEAAKVAADTKAELKTALLENLTELRNERTALIDRLNAVLDEWEAKGGEPEDHRKFITAVSGITVDVSDASATWNTVRGWLTSQEGGLRWLRNLGKFVGIVLAFAVLAVILGKVAERATRVSKRMSGLLRDFVNKTVRRVVFIIGVVIGLSALEVNIGPVLALIGGAAFVIGLALQGTLSNFASGIMILMYRPFDVGDAVEAGGVSGVVASMNLVSTHIKTFDNKHIIVPNNEIWGNVITNVTGSATRRVDMVFGVGYDDDLAAAQRVLERAVAEHPLILEDPAPVIKVHELGESSINFICRPWVRTADYWTVYWDLTRQVKEGFDAAGITIPFPQRDIHVHQIAGNGKSAAEEEARELAPA